MTLSRIEIEPSAIQKIYSNDDQETIRSTNSDVHIDLVECTPAQVAALIEQFGVAK